MRTLALHVVYLGEVLRARMFGVIRRPVLEIRQEPHEAQAGEVVRVTHRGHGKMGPSSLERMA